MKVPVNLNGTKTILEGSPDMSILKYLQNHTSHSAKGGCLNGTCGTCTILLNDKPAAGCKIPLGILRNTEIVTFDYFSKFEEYKSIMAGFEKAGIQLCGYCNAGKVFTAYQVLKSNKKPERKDIKEQVKHLSPCCVDSDTLVNGIIYAVGIHEKKQNRISLEIKG